MNVHVQTTGLKPCETGSSKDLSDSFERARAFGGSLWPCSPGPNQTAAERPGKDGIYVLDVPSGRRVQVRSKRAAGVDRHRKGRIVRIDVVRNLSWGQPCSAPNSKK